MVRVLTPEVQNQNHDVLDDVHSFVLRISVDRSRKGKGRHRPRFQLENVNEVSSHRFKSLDDLLEHLRGQVKTIFSELGVDESG